MSNSITIRIPKDLEDNLDTVASQEKTTKSEIVRSAIERYVAIKRFKQLRQKVLPFAEAQGLLTDEDIYKAIS